MPDVIWVKAVIKALVLPPTGPLLASAVGFVLWTRHPRLGRILAVGGIAVLFLLSIPVVANALQRALVASPPLNLAEAASAQAIVILGGGIRRGAVEYGGDTLGRLTLERVRYGARVARLMNLPVLVAGGSVYGGATEASLMRSALEDEFGVPVTWAEAHSRTTHENARFSSQMLRDAGVERVVLVAHSFDMSRAKAEFEQFGIAVVAAPTGLPARDLDGPLDLLPSIAGLQGSYYALYELLANAVYKLMPTTR